MLIYVKHFDYVALGHIHASQKIKYDYVRYAGSLMKYSFDEVHQKKGMVEVTIDETGVSTQIIPLKPQKDLVKVVGKYEDVLHYPNNENDFVAVELLDKQVIGHAYDFLKEKYPYLLQITYQSLEKVLFREQTKLRLTLAIRSVMLHLLVQLRIAKVKRNLVCSLNSTFLVIDK